ncbi:MAG: hypothetical protein IT366_21410 [Candidatus Hydrogenedentes bacterium]|nr:hypothetical protein [Candidatus Hydrogenedentota bacterium]
MKNLLGVDLFGEPIKAKGLGPLAQKFEMPPFSVLDARQGYWQERKRAWISLGIKSELGRSVSPMDGGFDSMIERRTNGTYGKDFAIGDKAEWERSKTSKEYGVNAHLSQKEQKALGAYGAYGTNTVERANGSVTGTSIFDPVLTELLYKWFCPQAGQIVDPFAGGSVRGIIAALLGFDYWGCDLRPEQIESNESQAAEICGEKLPVWVVGDAMEKLDTAPQADMIIACPPYGDLEVYSDDARDLSTMEYHTFIAALKRIIFRCSKLLKPNCFACFVVGDFRDKRTGNYRGFVADTIYAFRECGMELYNDAILVTCVGSLPIRVSAQFDAGRKLGKTHQNVLVFKK